VLCECKDHRSCNKSHIANTEKIIEAAKKSKIVEGTNFSSRKTTSTIDSFLLSPVREIGCILRLKCFRVEQEQYCCDFETEWLCELYFAGIKTHIHLVVS
jgi:hypothetical protein